MSGFHHLIYQLAYGRRDIMLRVLFSCLLVTSMTPFMFGCGEEKPMVEGEFDETEQIDPASEAEGEKQMKKDLQ
ncbi:hypothetical protein [Gimesia alba]|nr:hypothetical protein [Gimesia alba]